MDAQHTVPCRATWESLSGQQAESRSKGKAEARIFIGVSVGQARQGRMNSLELASLNNFSWLYTIRVVLSCLVPGPGMIKTEYIVSWGVWAR